MRFSIRSSGTRPHPDFVQERGRIFPGDCLDLLLQRVDLEQSFFEGARGRSMADVREYVGGRPGDGNERIQTLRPFDLLLS